MAFITSPGHLLYPAAITFYADNASGSSVSFNIDLAGTLPDAPNFAKFYGGGGAFEDRIHNRILRDS